MLQHKVNQMLFSPPLLLVALIYLCLPLCTESCECQTNNTLHLEIIENDGHGNTTSIFIIDFLEGYSDYDFTGLIWDSNNNREETFEKYFVELESTLTTIGLIDREEIAMDLRDPYSLVRFEFEINYYNYNNNEEPDCKCVTLDVIDLDDNTPTFETEQKVVEFHEDNTEVGRKVDIPIAVDDDEAGNGTSVYELVDESGKFELVYNYYSGSSRVNTLSLRHTGPLDYEQQPSYQLQLHAREDNESPDEDFLSILVRVLDSCDEPVMFITSHYTPSVIEEMADVPIVKVEATNDDNRTNCPLTYEITKACRRETNIQTSNCENIAIQSLFTLDLESGQLTLLEELDRESYSEYEVTIQASDSQHRSNSVTVIIFIKDINDNYPTFHQAVYSFNFEEGKVNVTGGRFEATDADIGSNADIRYELLDHHDKFSVDSVTGAVTNKVVLDREEQDKYTIRIRAVNVVSMTENAVSVRDVAEVQVTVIDVNDNPPVWENTLTTFTISSDSSVGAFIIALMATDADIGDNAEVSYKLIPSRLFDITTDNGIIRVKANLENEIGNHKVLVTAFNTHDPEQSTLRNVTIVVEEPTSSHPSSSSEIIGSITGVVALVIVVVILIMLVVLLWISLHKKRCSRDIIGGISSPTRSIIRPIPSSSVEFNRRSSSLNRRGQEVKFDTNVQEYGYDDDHAVSNSSNVRVSEFTICPDSSTDESPATPPRLPSTSLYHNGKLPSESFSHMSTRALRLPSSRDSFLYMHHLHPIHEDSFYDEDSEGNYDSTLPDNAASTNAPLPSVRHLLRMGPSSHSPPATTHLPPLPSMVPPHPFTHSPNHSATFTLPHYDELSIHRSSLDSLTDTPPHSHSHLSHENQHNRQSSQGPYPKYMPDGYIPPPSSTVSARFGATSFLGHFQVTDFEDTSTYASADLDEELKFHPEQTPSIYRLTTTSYDESQL